MWSFLVLGIIPGTPIQITFALWIIGVATVVVLGGLWLGHRAHLLRNWLIATVFVVTVRRSTPDIA